MPKISVIMGIYNMHKNKTIAKEAIDSILNQSYKNFEFIICDDGSTDNTYDLVESLTLHDPRVKIIKNKKNQGLAYSLNECLKISTGEYIARMDADDMSHLNRFEKQVTFLDNHLEYAIVGSDVILFDGTENWGYRKMPTEPLRKDFLFRIPFMHPTILIRRTVLEELNGYNIDKETLRCEDYDLFMRMYGLNYIGYNLNEGLFKVRENPEAYKRRKYKYRIDEAKVRYKGYKMLGLGTIGTIYSLKPLIVGLIPSNILAYLRNENKKADVNR